MSDKPWKKHERETARVFGVPRRTRGDNFSRSDVEVLVDIGTWLDKACHPSYLIVECKYRQEIGIVTSFLKGSKEITDRITILRVGDFILCRLNDIKDVIEDMVFSTLDIVELSDKYSILYDKKKEPKYLREYHEQASEYSEAIPQSSYSYPIVCMARASTTGRIVAIHGDVIQKMRQDLCLQNDIQKSYKKKTGQEKEINNP